MSSDPRRGLFAALAVMAFCLAWLVAAAFHEAPLREALGMNRHAVTFFVIVALVFAAAAAFVFARFAAVRAELLAGRRVLGRWCVDPRTWDTVARETLATDDREKRYALAIVLLLLVVVFAGFGVADPEAALGMMIVALVVAVAVVVAFLVDRRVRRSQARFRDGTVIVGERGLMSNGVLHVWALPANRLRGAELRPRPPALIVAYAWFGRSGWQEASVDLPVPSEASQIALRCRDALLALASAGRAG